MEMPMNGSEEKQVKHERKSVSFPFGECRICTAVATGVHYGVITCEGCKGFFKRSITQNLPYRCFFNNQCSINTETRNRCKACRFKKCLQLGMAMESVKMGRIPKKIKEKALKDLQRKQQHVDSENGHFSSVKRESVSSTSSSPSSMNSNTNIRQELDSNEELIVLPDETFNYTEKAFRTVDLIELTLSTSNLQINNLNHNLSALRLPSIFYESSSPLTYPESSMGEKRQSENPNTVSNYISQINERTLIDYMFAFEIRYSKNVLQIMKYLASKLCQPFLIYELDFEVTSFFRFIRWKMLNCYLKHTKCLQLLVERMFGLINLGITTHPGANASAEQIWADIQKTIPNDIKNLLEFAQDTLGFNELNPADFSRILNNRVFDFWTILHYPLFYQNESYLMTASGLQYSRVFMNQFIGKKTTDALHEFSQRLQALNLTHVEHSLTIPIVLCMPDEKLIDSESVHIIKYCYMYALYIQLCTTRTEDEAKTMFETILQIINSMDVLNRLCLENIGQLVLDKVSSHQ